MRSRMWSEGVWQWLPVQCHRQPRTHHLSGQHTNQAMDPAKRRDIPHRRRVHGMVGERSVCDFVQRLRGDAGTRGAGRRRGGPREALSHREPPRRRHADHRRTRRRAANLQRRHHPVPLRFHELSAHSLGTFWRPDRWGSPGRSSWRPPSTRHRRIALTGGRRSPPPSPCPPRAGTVENRPPRARSG